jgi:hypothetical protein
MKRRLFPVFIIALILSLAIISCDVLEALTGNTYEVTVTGGEGSGTYAVGSIVIIEAKAPGGQQFKEWRINPTVSFTEGTTKYSANAAFIMPAKDVNATANFSTMLPDYHLITVSDDGNGTANPSVQSAQHGATVTLTATAKNGYSFKNWQVLSGGITLSPNATTNPATFTMPDSAVSVKANFEAAPSSTYNVTVNGGTGSGSYAQGATVTITADTPPAGKGFSYWSTSSPGVTFDNSGNISTTFIMPANAVTVTANFAVNKTPSVWDYDISGFWQTAGSVTAPSITTRQNFAGPVDCSSGALTVYYEGSGGTTYAKSTTLPNAAGKYLVTFDVAAATGWNAASGLKAGTLTISAASGSRPQLAVADFSTNSSNPLDLTNTTSIQNLVKAKLTAHGQFRIHTLSDPAQDKDVIELLSADISRLQGMGVDYLINGSVEKLVYTDEYGLTVRALDVQTGRILYSKSVLVASGRVESGSSGGVATNMIDDTNNFMDRFIEDIAIGLVRDPQIPESTPVSGYAVGSTGPAGGKVFYDKGYYSDGWRYLEVAPGSNADPLFDWSEVWTDVPGTRTELGAGRRNTLLILDKLERLGQSGMAAQYCANLNFGGYDDWFLPSKDEFVSMVTETNLMGWYCTSSQFVDGYCVWAHGSSVNSLTSSSKKGSFFIRAVRAF